MLDMTERVHCIGVLGFLSLWETFSNSVPKPVEFDRFRAQARRNKFLDKSGLKE